MIDELIHTDAKGDSQHDVHAGVLFQKHSGQDDGYAQDAGTSDCPFLFGKIRRVHDCHMGGNRIEHMDAWQNIGRSISPIQETYHLDKNVVPSELCRTKQMTVRIHRGDDQEQGHASVKEYDIAVKIFPVLKKQPEEDCADIQKPEKIRDDKILAKRNVIIQRKANDMIGQAGPAFQPDKPRQIDYKI